MIFEWKFTKDYSEFLNVLELEAFQGFELGISSPQMPQVSIFGLVNSQARGVIGPQLHSKSMWKKLGSYHALLAARAAPKNTSP